MAHENSVTEPRMMKGLGRRWMVYDNSGPNKGATLGPRMGFATMEAANAFARQRSAEHEMMKAMGRKQRVSR